MRPDVARSLWLPLICIIGLASEKLAEGAGTLAGTFSTIPKGTVINLSAAGALDWVHWGLYTATSLDRKAGVTPLIGNFTAVSDSLDTNAAVYVYQFSDNFNGYSWSDGTPTAIQTNTTTGVWAYGSPLPTGTGFEFAVPADTTVRTLKVYVGAFAAKGLFKASLSDSSAPIYTDSSLSNSRNGDSAVYSIQYAANSPGQTLTVRWTEEPVIGNPTSGNVTLQAAALTSSNANNPPSVSLTSPGENASFTTGASITLSANAFDLDGTVSTVEFYDGDTKLGEDSGGASPYSFTWAGAAAGYHVLTAVAIDNQSDFSTSMPVEIFVNGSGGALAGAGAVPASQLDLTLEGTTDWAHWGLATNSSFDHKNGVTQKISDVTVLGTNLVQQYSDNLTAYSWSDGTPTAGATNSTTGIYITGLTNGFQIHAPADTTTKRLKVYVGLYGARGNFQAYLSDFSAPAYTDTSLSNVYGNSYAVFSLDYAAASAGQSLIVQYRSLVLYDYDFGNVTWQAATLVETNSGTVTSNIPPAITTQPQSQTVYAGSNATFSVTAAGTVPLSYEWRFNGAALPGGNASGYAVTNAQPTNAGSYTVVVTNVVGAVTSAPAVLTVLGPLQLQYQLVPTNGGMGLMVSPTVAQPYSLDVCATLTNWTSIFTNQTGASGSNFVQTAVTNGPHRFYRGKRWP